MEHQEWMNDLRLKNIDNKKLDFLQKLVFESSNLSEKQKIPFLMALANKAQKDKVKFSREETLEIIEVLKDYSTQDELQKINSILKVFHER
ncbi:MAG: hypothetical protein IIX48_01160 [Lachnospiraceae bacterium]|nr:hypothetical protein [Lachnospiraceae bacterium]MBQ1171192.1 hypothetical protein [Lachnospiraceae bacterium]